MDRKTFSQYGWIVIVTIIICILIGSATPFAQLFKTEVEGVFTNLNAFANNALENVNGGSGGGNGGGGEGYEPVLIEGNGQTHNSSQSTSLRFVSNAPYNEFVEVRIDSEVVDPSNYTVTEGSTIIEFTPEYSALLALGSHTIAVVSDSGSANGSFDVSVSYALILNNSDDSTNAVPMIFVTSTNKITAGDTYNSDTYGELTVSYVYTGFDTASYDSYSSVPWKPQAMSITSVVVEDEIIPTSTAYWFYYFYNCSQMNLTKLNTENVTNMKYMFYCAGYDATTWSIGDISGWDVSSVTNMFSMFYYAGYSATTWSIGDISGWDVSSVITMDSMFYNAGYNATTWSIGDISGWDVSSVEGMSNMFNCAGRSASYSLDLSGWNVSNVTQGFNFNLSVESKVISPF